MDQWKIQRFFHTYCNSKIMFLFYMSLPFEIFNKLLYSIWFKFKKICCLMTLFLFIYTIFVNSQHCDCMCLKIMNGFPIEWPHKNVMYWIWFLSTLLWRIGLWDGFCRTPSNFKVRTRMILLKLQLANFRLQRLILQTSQKIFYSGQDRFWLGLIVFVL